MTTVLIAEDEVRVSGFVQRGLRAAGFQCTVAIDGHDALFQAQTGQFDLVLLDVGLPGLDGFQVLRALRATDPTLPVIMLSARHSAEDIVSGLDDGANDYITKPFKFDEVLARVRLRLRERPIAVHTPLHRGSIRLHPESRRAIVGEVIVDLSAREFALALEFFRHPGQILSYEQLMNRVWGTEVDHAVTAVSVAVASLRSKIGADAIETVRGVGYRLK
ncbi:MAG: response regulator transcription factor [Actinomycetota bacterium]